MEQVHNKIERNQKFLITDEVQLVALSTHALPQLSLNEDAYFSRCMAVKKKHLSSHHPINVGPQLMLCN
eukprot:c22827_g1_i2 orf=65-271(-)